jgi:hypothetical protein
VLALEYAKATVLPPEAPRATPPGRYFPLKSRQFPVLWAALLPELNKSGFETDFLLRTLANTGDFQQIIFTMIDTVASKFDAV